MAKIIIPGPKPEKTPQKQGSLGTSSPKPGVFA
jgi:hypothetical protein